MKRAGGYFPSILITGLLLLYVSVLAAVVPWTGDDVTYLFSFADGSPIDSLKGVFASQVAHWHCMNGRFLAHFLVQTFLVFVGRAGFVILNGLAYIVLLLLLLRLCGRPFRDWKSTLAVSVLIILAMPTKFVPTCQIGYVWMFDLALLFVAKWMDIVRDGKRPSEWNLAWLVPLSFLAGAGQEAIVIGIAAALMIYSLCHIRDLGIFGWGMLIAFGLGAMSLCLSPANFGRTADVHGTVGGMSGIGVRMIKFFLYQRVSYILLALVVWLKIARKISLASLYRSAPFFWNAWCVLILFNLAIGVFGNRQLFGAEIMAVILLLKIIDGYARRESRLPGILVCAVVAGLVTVNTVAAFHSRTLYRTILTEYESSPDGAVTCELGFFDRHFRESGPCDAWSWYVTGSVDKFLHLEGAPEGKTLKLQ